MVMVMVRVVMVRVVVREQNTREHGRGTDLQYEQRFADRRVVDRGDVHHDKIRHTLWVEQRHCHGDFASKTMAHDLGLVVALIVEELDHIARHFGPQHRVRVWRTAVVAYV